MKADSHTRGGHLSKLSRLQVAGLAEAAGEYEELGTETAFRKLGQRHLEVRLVSVVERETYMRKMGHALEKIDEEVLGKPVLDLVGHSGARRLSKPMKIEGQEVLDVHPPLLIASTALNFDHRMGRSPELVRGASMKAPVLLPLSRPCEQTEAIQCFRRVEGPGQS